MSLIFEIDQARVAERQRHLRQEVAFNGAHIGAGWRAPELTVIRKRLGGLLVTWGTRLQAASPINQEVLPEVSPLPESVPAAVESVEETAPTRLALPGSAPQNASDWLEVRSVVLQALRQLPRPQQQALILYAEHGCSLDEIAHILQEKRDCVAVYLYEAQRNLRKMLPPEALAWLSATPI